MKKTNASTKYTKKSVFSLSGKTAQNNQVVFSIPTTSTITTNPTTGSFTC